LGRDPVCGGADGGGQRNAREAPARPLFDAVASLPLVRLLSPGAVQTEVVVLGVMAGDHAPLALLSVDGRPAEAYAPGQRLGPCTVASISASAVELNQAGQSRSLPVPELPPVPSDGIVPRGTAVPSPRRLRLEEQSSLARLYRILPSDSGPFSTAAQASRRTLRYHRTTKGIAHALSRAFQVVLHQLVARLPHQPFGLRQRR
jgi:general secretion pathway protein C